MGQLPRRSRIRTRRDIGRLLESQRLSGADLDLFWTEAEGPTPRATCITPKFGHTGVERNRLRRRLKEIIRQSLIERDENRDYLVRAHRSAYDRDYDELRAAVIALADRATRKPSSGE